MVGMEGLDQIVVALVARLLQGFVGLRTELIGLGQRGIEIGEKRGLVGEFLHLQHGKARPVVFGDDLAALGDLIE